MGTRRARGARELACMNEVVLTLCIISLFPLIPGTLIWRLTSRWKPHNKRRVRLIVMVGIGVAFCMLAWMGTIMAGGNTQ